MLKNILKLDGAQALNKKEQQGISGGDIISAGCDPTCFNCSGTCVQFNCSPSTACPVWGYVCITIGPGGLPKK